MKALKSRLNPMRTLIKLSVLFIVTATHIVQADQLFAGSGFAAKSLDRCDTHLKRLNHVIGWQVEWPRQWQASVENGVNDIDSALIKWAGLEPAINAAIEDLRKELNVQAAPHIIATHVHQQVKGLLSKLEGPKSPYKFLKSNHNKALLWNRFVENTIVPSVSKYEHFLRNHYLPKASNSSGLYGSKGNEECFFSAVEWWTSLKPTPDEIERIGRRYLSLSMDRLEKTLQKGESVDELMFRLKSGTGNNKVGKSELISISEAAISKAIEKIPAAFLSPVERSLIVTEMSEHIQKSAPAGYYQGVQGDVPAQYIVNTSRPGERRLMAEVLAFHEGVPGHHLWDTYPRKVASMGYNSGLLEGWAIYAEYLADELNLYSSTFDRQGMMAKHLWAASRLIVEPGLHLKGWSRDTAVNFMLKNTLLSKREAEIEVDRYIAMPGQSLGYMLGADLILSERGRARGILGKDFDLAVFHDVILQKGVRPLPQVRDDIRIWVNTTADKPS